jgi:hypothetical protein
MDGATGPGGAGCFVRSPARLWLAKDDISNCAVRLPLKAHSFTVYTFPEKL